MKEPADRKKQRAKKIIAALRKTYPGARTALTHEDPLQLLVATILSAQCTDERVNMVTPILFSTYRTAAEFSGAETADLEAIIRSTGFFRSKARSIRNCCAAIMERHGGIVPDTMEDLVRLPGVGRKTANVVLGSAFGKSEGVVVDTHVGRLSGRLGLSEHRTPEKIEVDLMEVYPKRDWTELSHLLIWHGRKVCRARKPLCRSCEVSLHCPSADL